MGEARASPRRWKRAADLAARLRGCGSRRAWPPTSASYHWYSGRHQRGLELAAGALELLGEGYRRIGQIEDAHREAERAPARARRHRTTMSISGAPRLPSGFLRPQPASRAAGGMAGALGHTSSARSASI